MNINIIARKTSVKEPFKARVEKKLTKLDRFFEDDAKATVTVINEHDRETVEITISAGGMVYRSERTTGDRIDSLEAVVDSLFRQIVKNKDKLERRLRDTAFDPVYTAEDELITDEYRVVKTKRFRVKPMNVEEAILQLNMIGHSFFVFLNEETEEINVVYKRRNGDYGVIEPMAE